MCGIAGIFEADMAPEELQAALERMELSLLHRGPDEGAVRIFKEPRGGLSVRRLSIVDLEHGSQPCANEDSTVFTLLNGEIYNHRELRKDLQDRGHRYRGDSDTETVVHLYEEYGIECLGRLRGMFALAIYDTARRQLLLARDGAGMKPLYFARTDRGLLFASDARTVFASGLVRPEANPAAIDAYLAIGFVPAPLSAFRGLERLRAGEYLVAGSGGFRQGHFWRYRYGSIHPRTTDEDYSAELDSLLSAAVRSHLAADVPVGAFLSGGWDSSLTASLAARSMSRKLKTFSIVFPDDPGADESRFSRLMALRLGSDHHEIEFRSSLMPDLVPKITRAIEEPCAKVPAGVLYVLASLAHGHVKAVLSGEGADELFAGYEQFRVNLPYVLRHFVPRRAARLAAGACQHVRLRRGLRVLGAKDGRTADGEWDRLFTPEDKRGILSADFQSGGARLGARAHRCGRSRHLPGHVTAATGVRVHRTPRQCHSAGFRQDGYGALTGGSHAIPRSRRGGVRPAPSIAPQSASRTGKGHSVHLGPPSPSSGDREPPQARVSLPQWILDAPFL